MLAHSAYHFTPQLVSTSYTLEAYLVIMTARHDVQVFDATLVLPHSPSIISSHSPTYALIYALTHPPTHSCQVRIFNLDDVRAIRDLDPIDIDSLVAIKGMVTRTGNIIPDLRWAGQHVGWQQPPALLGSQPRSVCFATADHPSMLKNPLSCLTMDHPWAGMKAAFLGSGRNVYCGKAHRAKSPSDSCFQAGCVAMQLAYLLLPMVVLTASKHLIRLCCLPVCMPRQAGCVPL